MPACLLPRAILDILFQPGSSWVREVALRWLHAGRVESFLYTAGYRCPHWNGHDNKSCYASPAAPIAPRSYSRMLLLLFYYAIMVARHTHIVMHANISTKKTQKDKNSKTVKRNRTGKTRATLGLLYCAGECVPYSLLYCLPANVSR